MQVHSACRKSMLSGFIVIENIGGISLTIHV